MIKTWRKFTSMVVLYSFLSLLTAGCGNKEGDSENNPVVPAENNAPVIQGVNSNPSEIFSGMNVNLQCSAFDEDSDELSYNWEAQEGNIFPNNANPTNWTAPGNNDLESRIINLQVTVSDGKDDTSYPFTLMVNNPEGFEYSSEDVMVDCRSPDENEGDNYILGVGKDRDIIQYSFIRFDLDLIYRVSEAKLRVTVANDITLINDLNTHSLDVSIHRILEDWNESSVTWNSCPNYGPPLAQSTMPETNYFEEPVTFYIDVTNLVNYWYENPDENFGLMFSANENGWACMYSKEAPDNPWENYTIDMTPALEYTYGD